MTMTTKTVTDITELVRGRTETVLLDTIFGQPILQPVRHLIEQFTTFASHLATTKWGGKHGLLFLVLREAKMISAARNINLDCEWFKKPELLNPRIEDRTQGRELIQLQAY